MDKKVQIKAFWDSEARVWVAKSDDVPGLITEADTMERLVDKLHVLIPELLQENGMGKAGQAIPFDIHSERQETVLCGL